MPRLEGVVDRVSVVTVIYTVPRNEVDAGPEPEQASKKPVAASGSDTRNPTRLPLVCKLHLYNPDVGVLRR